MKLFVGPLFMLAPASLALKVPQNMVGFPRMDMVLRNFSNMPTVNRAIEHAPKFLEAAIALRQSMNGSNVIGDSLKSITAVPESMSSFLQLERRMESEVEKSHVSAEIQGLMQFASKRLKNQLQGFGIDSINVGIARSGAPWYSLMKSLVDDQTAFEYFDNTDVKLVGSAAFFLNFVFRGAEAMQWRLCMAAGLAASVYFRGKFYDWNSMSGSDIGGEDFYLGFAVAANVPGWSWAMTFNHDYVTRYLENTEVMKIKNEKYALMNHQFHHLARLSGGFEFTSTKPLKDLVAINFGYCIMGRTQGGACIDPLAEDNMIYQREEHKKVEAQEAQAPNLRKENTREKIMNAEKWSKNTVETGVGHCWCGKVKIMPDPF